jgi:hypothetical protein
MARTGNFGAKWFAGAAFGVLVMLGAIPLASAQGIPGLSVNSTALLQSDGSIVISGTLACGDARAIIDFLVHQSYAETPGSGSRNPITEGVASTSITCDSTAKAWSVVVQPFHARQRGPDRFIPGNAQVEITLFRVDGSGNTIEQIGTNVVVNVQSGSAGP